MPEIISESKFEEENVSIMIEINRIEGGNLALGISTWILASQPGPWPLNLDPGL
jgi:hypothetical protein